MTELLFVSKKNEKWPEHSKQSTLFGLALVLRKNIVYQDIIGRHFVNEWENADSYASYVDVSKENDPNDEHVFSCCLL